MAETPFVTACREGDISRVMGTLNSLDPAAQPAQKQLNRGLELACWGSHPSLVDLLLSRGARLTGLAVIGACNKSNPATFQAFLSHGWDVNSKADGQLALRLCVDSEDCTRLLLANGADPNLRGDDDVTPLVSAACCAFSNVPEMLVSHGAAIGPECLWTALDPFGAGGPRMVKYFLDKGIDPNTASDFWGTPLHQAVACTDERKRLGKILVLLEAGADPHLKAAAGNYKGISPIELAESLGKTEELTLLMAEST